MQVRWGALGVCVVLGLVGGSERPAHAQEPPVPVPHYPNQQAPEAAPVMGKTVTTALYTVKDGNKVDPKTLMGWKTWRALDCERCHGASQQGLVGPSLVEALKVLTKDQFHTTIMQGRLPKGMPPFSTSHMVQENWEGLYSYLKGRSDGNILPGHLYPIADPHSK